MCKRNAYPLILVSRNAPKLLSCNNMKAAHLAPLFYFGMYKESTVNLRSRRFSLNPSSSFIQSFLLNTFLNHEDLSLPSSAFLHSPGIIPLRPPASVRLPRQLCFRLVSRYRSCCCLPIGTMADYNQPGQR